MRQFVVLMCLAFVAVEAVIPGYNYKQPPPAPAHPPQQVQQTAQAIRQTYSARPQLPAQSNNGIYSVVQAPPLVSFTTQHHQQQQHSQQQQQQQQQQTFVQQQNFVPQVQQNFQQAAINVQEQGYVVPQPIQQHPIPQGPAPQQIAVPAPQPSIPQSHQQQVIQQQVTAGQRQVFADQLSLPIAAPQQAQPVQQQQIFQQQQSFQRPQTAIITKDIYIHSAPEDHEEVGLDQPLENGPIRKNYRIVFIKAPSQNLRLASAALKRAQAVNEEKTVIYVLSKKPDFSEVQQQLIQSQGEQKTHKPEVYFIKYKTQEEAQRAQQEIQAQYDALGGSTHISDEGVAPLTSANALNFGATSGSNTFNQQSFQSSSISGGSSVHFDNGLSSKYLPVITKK